MKILWVINNPFPCVSKKLNLKIELSQSWLYDLAYAVKNSGIDLCIASVEHVEDLTCLDIDGIRHYVLPVANKFKKYKVYDKYWEKVINGEKPDLLHVHGTERIHPLSLLKKYGDIPSILTIQGIMTKISQEFYGGLTRKEIFKYRTLRENMRFGGMYFTKKQYLKQAKNEKEIIESVCCVTGRTLWDYSVMKEINPDIKYYRCFYNLRDEFYHAEKWDIKKINRHSIYTAFCNYPLKGLHILIKAVQIVKKKFPDVVINVPGMQGDSNNKLICNTGYKKYIWDLIVKLHVEDNVRFIGGQKAADVVSNMQKSHVCIVSSAIEGASATIREAMHIGTPCICSYRGGMTELLRDKVSGFYYDFSEYSYLAERIIQLFSDDEMAVEFSKNAVCDAEIMHDREKNSADMINLYNNLVK